MHRIPQRRIERCVDRQSDAEAGQKRSAERGLGVSGW
jgi:hypothetical protein